MECADSHSFFAVPLELEAVHLGPLQARFLCLKDFSRKFFLLPFALFYKGCKTIFRAFALCFSMGLIVLSFGTSESIREYFVQRMIVLAKDLADWILLPVALVSRLVRLILAFILHPNFYYKN